MHNFESFPKMKFFKSFSVVLLTLLLIYCLFLGMYGSEIWVFRKIKSLYEEELFSENKFYFLFKTCILPISIYLSVFLISFLSSIASKLIIHIYLTLNPPFKFGLYFIPIAAIIIWIFSVLQFWQIPAMYNFIQISGCIFFTLNSLFIALEFAVLIMSADLTDSYQDYTE